MTSALIAAVGHLAVRTPDVDACVAQAAEVMGLAETARDGTGVYLTEGRHHHSLHYIDDETASADHLGLEVVDAAALDEIRRRLDVAGASWSDHEDGILGDTVRVTGPEGFVYELYLGMPHAPRPPKLGPGVRPNRFGHITIRPEDAKATKDFLVDVLDFRISEALAGGYFLRCNVDHHGMGVLPGPGELHHYAWEVSSIADVGRLCDRVHECGLKVLWGPVRHGAGNNIAAYFADPAGIAIEYYADMERIYDDNDYVVPEWNLDEEYWVSLWQPGRPDGFRDFGIPPARVAQATGA